MPHLADVQGVRIGAASDERGATGCTVVLCEEGAVGGVDVRGSAPGTRETDLLRPMNLVQRVHAILLAGGSAFGLEAAGGVMRYLEERGIGLDTRIPGVPRVPLVPAAVLFDLQIGSPSARPTPEMAMEACRAATDGPPAEGSVGAGTGATIGKILGPSGAMKGGVGSWSISLPGGVIVGALAVVNAFGDVVDDRSGEILAGARDPGSRRFVSTSRMLLESDVPAAIGFGQSTTLVVVATNARLTKEDANWLARIAHDGLARVIAPVHTLYDGDTVFALSLGNAHASLLSLGAGAVEAVAESVKRGVRAARTVAGVPGLAG